MTLVQRFVASGFALARNRRDGWNELVGGAAAGRHLFHMWSSEKYFKWTNRAFFGIGLASVIYANTPMYAME